MEFSPSRFLKRKRRLFAARSTKETSSISKSRRRETDGFVLDVKFIDLDDFLLAYRALMRGFK